MFFLYSQRTGCYFRQEHVFQKIYFPRNKAAFFHLRNITKLLNVFQMQKNKIELQCITCFNKQAEVSPRVRTWSKNMIISAQLYHLYHCLSILHYLIFLIYKALNGLAPSFITLQQTFTLFIGHKTLDF